MNACFSSFMARSAPSLRQGSLRSQTRSPQKNGKNVKSYIEIQYPDFKPIPIEHLGQLPHPQPSKKPEREYRDEGNHEKDNESHGRCQRMPSKRAIGTKSSTVLLTNSSTLSAG